MDKTLRTVNPRIAFVVDPDGQWYAVGWGNADETPGERRDRDKCAMDSALDEVAEGERRYILTAELSIPGSADATVVAASVEEVSP